MLPARCTAGDLYAIPQFDVTSRGVADFLHALHDFQAAFRPLCAHGPALGGESGLGPAAPPGATMG